MFMINRYVLDVCVHLPVEIFTAPPNLSLANLLTLLQLKKGEGGSPLQLLTGQERKGNEKFPSSLLLQRDQDSGLKIVGALAFSFAKCRDFAIMTSETELIERAQGLAEHVLHYNPDKPEDYKRYATHALAREE